MKLELLDERYKPAVNRFIKDEWGGPFVVTRGNLFDSRELPGFVFSEEDALKGAILYQIENNECEIAVLFSLEEGKGIGTGLIHAVLDRARQNHCKRVWLITTNDNTHAIRFYQKYGFSLKAVHIDAIELSRNLKPQFPLKGYDEIPIKHEFKFEIFLLGYSRDIKYRTR